MCGLSVEEWLGAWLVGRMLVAGEEPSIIHGREEYI